MKISFLGAAKTVTGSRFLLEIQDQKILIDCGLFQGLKKLREQNWQVFPFDPESIDAVILTHAHIDHSGYLPKLVKEGFKGPIYSTHATDDLCQILLPDSAYLQEEDAEYRNKTGTTKHHPALPLYDRNDADAALKLFKPQDYDVDFEIADGIKCRLTPSGHILGSSFVTISAEKRQVVFSGDLGRPNDLIMLPPRWIKQADYLILESTYGDREHANTDILDDLEAVVNRTAKRHGTLLIPAFAVGRAQAVLHALHILKKAKRIPNIPIYVNSPMASSATDLFVEYANEHRLSLAESEETCNAAVYIRSVEESIKLTETPGPMVIISASGMATGGRVLHHLKTLGPDPKNTVAFVGFQAAGTRGEHLLAGKKTVKIHGQEIPIEADVTYLDNLSTHADQSEIIDWLRHFHQAPRKTFIVHGEAKASEVLAEKIRSELKWESEVPSLNSSYTL